MAAKSLIDIWTEKELRVLAAKKRRYPHFDPFLNFERNRKSLVSFLQDTKKVEKHSFYPFIKSSILTPRYKKLTDETSAGEAKRVIDIKDRPVAFAAHFDSFIYSWYSTILNEKYKKKAKKWGIYDSVLAYVEKSKCNIDFAFEACSFLRERKNCVALAFDIHSFFDHLDHEHLERMWGTVINVRGHLPKHHFKVLQSLTEYAYVEMADLEKSFPSVFRKLERNRKIKDPKKRFYVDRICTPLEFRKIVRAKGMVRNNSFINTIVDSARVGKLCGIPQGSPISAVLSNIYMIEFDIRLTKLVKELGGMYFRYSDDLLIIIEVQNEATVKEAVKEEIAKCHLTINPSKTEIVYFKPDTSGITRGCDCNGRFKNLQYLGFEFNGQNFYIRSSSMSRYHRRMTARIRENLKAGYGRSAVGDKIFMKKLLNRYSIKGRRNFVSYAHRAAETMDSRTIRRQYRNSVQKVIRAFTDRRKKFEEKRGICQSKGQ